MSSSHMDSFLSLEICHWPLTRFIISYLKKYLIQLLLAGPLCIMQKGPARRETSSQFPEDETKLRNFLISCRVAHASVRTLWKISGYTGTADTFEPSALIIIFRPFQTLGWGCTWCDVTSPRGHATSQVDDSFREREENGKGRIKYQSFRIICIVGCWL